MTAKRVSAVERAFQILELASEAPEGLTFSDVWQRAGCSKATAFARVAELKRMHLLDQVGRRYVPGQRLKQLCAQGIEDRDLQTVADPVMQALVDGTGLTSHLGVLNGDQLVFIKKIESRAFVRFASYSGMLQPFYLSSMGKAQAAFVPEDVLRQILEGCTFVARTGHTITNAQQLLVELETIRARGYALEDEENERGVRCIGAPIFGQAGYAVAAVSLTGTTSELVPESYERVIELVKAAAGAISQQLGWRATAARDRETTAVAVEGSASV